MVLLFFTFFTIPQPESPRFDTPWSVQRNRRDEWLLILPSGMGIRYSAVLQHITYTVQKGEAPCILFV